MKDIIDDYIKSSIDSISALESIKDAIEKAARVLSGSLKDGGKLIVFGNGGSAADSQHIAAEIVSRFRKERKALPAIALSTNTSILTAISNDYDFSDIFARQIEAHGKNGDVAIAISTSGNAKNVSKGVETARGLGIKVIALTGASGGALKDNCDVLLNVPSDVTSFIQECHLVVYHLLCHLIEEELF